MTCYIGIVFIDPLLKTVAIVQCIYRKNISFLIYKKDIRLWLIHYLFILFFSFCCLFLANVNHTKNIIETKLNITNRRKRVFISGKIKNSETCFCKLLKDIFSKHKWAFRFPGWLSQTLVSCVFVKYNIIKRCNLDLNMYPARTHQHWRISFEYFNLFNIRIILLLFTNLELFV